MQPLAGSDVPYQDIAAGSLHSSQEHPAYYRGMILRSVRAVTRAVSEARIGLTALLAARDVHRALPGDTRTIIAAITIGDSSGITVPEPLEGLVKARSAGRCR